MRINYVVFLNYVVSISNFLENLNFCIMYLYDNEENISLLIVYVKVVF